MIKTSNSHFTQVRVKTGILPWAGTSAKVGLKILGTQCATKARILQGESCFQRNGLDIFRMSLDRRYPMLSFPVNVNLIFDSSRSTAVVLSTSFV